MTRPSLGLCFAAQSVIALSLIALYAGSAAAQTSSAAQSPISVQTPDSTRTAPVGDDTQKPSKSHSDASGMLLLGAVVGGAALMGGGGHGSGDTSGSSFSSSAVAPQLIVTQNAPRTVPTSAPVVVSTPTPVIITTTAANPVPDAGNDPAPVQISTFAPVAPVVTVTVPPVNTAPIIEQPVTFIPVPAPTPIQGGGPAPTLFPAPLDPSAVPEPGTTAALVLGSLMLGALVLRARRKTFNKSAV